MPGPIPPLTQQWVPRPSSVKVLTLEAKQVIQRHLHPPETYPKTFT